MRLSHVCIVAGFAAISHTTVAWAQDKSAQFWLEPDAKNLVSCTRLDAAMSRNHTVTIKGNQGEITSAGGIHDKLKLVRPNVYTSDFTMGGTSLVVLADLSVTPPTLTVTEKNQGCKWNAKKP
jgi:hypothetical protein